MKKSAAKSKPLEESTTRTQVSQTNQPASHPLLQFQSNVGNQAVTQYLRRKTDSTLESDGIPKTDAPSIVSEAIQTSGRPLDTSTREFFEPRFGHDFSNIRIHDDDKAASSANAVNAKAYTIGEHIVLGANQAAPQSDDGRKLLAHELAHTIQQGHSDEVPVVQRKPAPERMSFPWLGKIDNTWAASLRSSPSKAAADPHGNTIADLPRGTDVTVFDSKGGWMHVQVEIDGKELTGYVSTELITYVSASAFAVPEIVLEMKLPSVAEAFVELKRAETRKAKEGAAFKPTEEEQNRIDIAIVILEGTKKYVVDKNSFAVNFVAQTGPAKTQITTIEDFILFVEQVEKQYPSATPQEVVSEVRQMWYSGENWEILVASRGILEKGQGVDIQQETNPVALRFDMDQIAPLKDGHRQPLLLNTRMGKVDIGHVMAGIDARLSGFSRAEPNPRDHPDKWLKYKTLESASKGETLDFATWAGDLGQTYAEYLVDRYVNNNASASLKTVTQNKAPADELLGDIHGYIAVEVYKDVPVSKSPTGGDLKISNILRDMYLVPKTTGKGTSQEYVERVAGKSTTDLKPFIMERSLRFARPWFAKKAYEARGYWDSKGVFPAGILENALAEFDKLHSDNEKIATAENKLETLVDSFVKQVSGSPVK